MRFLEGTTGKIHVGEMIHTEHGLRGKCFCGKTIRIARPARNPRTKKPCPMCYGKAIAQGILEIK